ncbi:MAG: hypothetical protein JWO36_5427 [Myxococcales bacterium]|nr:hypothetical protein [Myxococcales bacterium]
MIKLFAFLVVLCVTTGSQPAFAQPKWGEPGAREWDELHEVMDGTWFIRKDTQVWDQHGDDTTHPVRCAQLLDQLAAAKVPDSAVMELKYDSPEYEAGKHTLAEIRKSCEHIQRSTWVNDIEKWALAAMKDKKKLDRNDYDARMPKNCIQVYDKAIKAGISPTEKVADKKVTNAAGEEFLWTGSIEDIKKKWCDAGLAKAQNQDEANEAPYRTVLKNDKLRLALKWLLTFQLPGGAHVTSPKQLASANVWYLVDVELAGAENHCLDKPARRLIRFQFDAQHKLVSETQKSFCGDPPKRAYR